MEQIDEGGGGGSGTAQGDASTVRKQIK